MKTDFRALCARMADELDRYRQLLMDDRRETHALAAEARTLLAQPEVEMEDSERLRSLFDATRYQMADALGVDRGHGWTSLAMEIGRLKASCTPQPPALADTHYEWELQDADGDWQAGGSANSLDDVRREGTRYLQTYAQDGPHKLIIRQHLTQTIDEMTNG